MKMDVKEKIKQKVNDISDPRLLEELMNVVEVEYEIDQTKELSKLEKKAIDDGIADAEAGKLYANSEARGLVKQWSNK